MLTGHEAIKKLKLETETNCGLFVSFRPGGSLINHSPFHRTIFLSPCLGVIGQCTHMDSGHWAGQAGDLVLEPLPVLPGASQELLSSPKS